jgi:hypothetical protein
MTIINDLTCLRCGAHGPDIQFPIFPLSGAPFGSVCVDCDHQSPWSERPLACVDCEIELDETEAWGNRKYGDPRCEDCHQQNEGDNE